MKTFISLVDKPPAKLCIKQRGIPFGSIATSRGFPTELESLKCFLTWRQVDLVVDLPMKRVNIVVDLPMKLLMGIVISQSKELS